MKKSEMDKLRDYLRDAIDTTMSEEVVEIIHELKGLLDTFEVDSEPEAKQDRDILIGDFIQVTTLDGCKFIAQALYVAKNYIITTRQEQYDRSICRVWFGCPMCGKE